MDTQVYKFGGASVQDSTNIKNVCEIIKKHQHPLVVVISAMGKTTNAMEEILEAFIAQDLTKLKKAYNLVFNFHNCVVNELFPKNHLFHSKFDELFNFLWEYLQTSPSGNYDFDYDQIVSFGEIISTQIISNYASSIGLKNNWIDIRTVLKTDDKHRDAGVNWGLSMQLVHKEFNMNKNKVYITQGFIGSTINNKTTTLGREGSDYTGAILANLLKSKSLTIWKDVCGVLNADPKWYPKAKKLNEISYPEAVELAYFGAQVIHPKTLKPLQNENIPLYVKSFIDDQLPGTVIQSNEPKSTDKPVYILKRNQLFVTITPRDFSFIVEDNLRDIFAIFSRFNTKINLMQNSALNFSVCIDKKRNFSELLKELKKDFLVRYNSDIELVTIRNYTQESIDEILKGKEVIDSQHSRNTARFVLRSSIWTF